MARPPIELVLFRHADTAWREVVRPWLEAGRGRLERTAVVVPTRGQAHALKQRCLVEGVPLLGVEFLTPGLARRKWPAAERPALGRELLLVGLRALIEERLAPLAPGGPEWGLWKSLQSDPGRALEDFDEMLAAGFRAEDFPLPALQRIFADLAAWAGSLGYALAPEQSLAAALQPPAAGEPRLAERLLIYGPGPEVWGEFFNLAALARRCGGITVALPEPEWRGRADLDERWIELWSAILGVEARPLDAPDPAATCGAVGGLWTGDGGSAERARVVVGLTRADEMALVADEIVRLLAEGARNVGVVFPRADAARFRLAGHLVARGVPFADLLPDAGALAADGAAHRALLQLFERGCRIEELLELWPFLRALNLAHQPLAAARAVCQRLFDESQSHALAPLRERLAADPRDEAHEVARVAGLLLPPWPAALTLADALARFEAACAGLGLVPPAWPALAALARREGRALPARVAFGALAAFLPAAAPAAGTAGRGVFAPVTLTTRHRAAGLPWSHLILVECNSGVWPERRDPSCWLTDEQRAELNQRGRFSLGLFTSEDRSSLERRLAAALARDTAEGLIFTAALYDDEDAELRLAPNAWLERVLLAQAAEAPEAALARLARRVEEPVPEADESGWLAVWNRRRDPAAPFDEFFFSADPALGPERLPAQLIERGVRDPACLWHDAILGARRVEWAPLIRERKKSLGQLAHRLLAEALKGEPAGGGFSIRPPADEARAKLAAALAEWRDRWPRDRYWDSFHAELGDLARVLLDKVLQLDASPYAAVEIALPPGATVPLAGGRRLPVRGRLDLALSDRPEWRGARIDIVDFKTGADSRLSAERMAAQGASLQLGVYLAAVASLGAASARVWMVRPEAREAANLGLADLTVALAPLARLEQHLATGRYGALTPDRTAFARSFDWPLACPPIAHAVLVRKFAATFGAAAPAAGEAAADE